MGPAGHHLTGLAAGILTAAAGWHAFGASSLVAIPMGWSGGTAPDWLEIAHAEFSSSRQKWVRVSVIPHRTITHWWPLWVALAFVVVTMLFHVLHLFAARDAEIVIRMALAGFVAGGVMHLLMDLPNPTGIPILSPFARSRKSLRWWRSGNAFEPMAGVLMTAMACVVLWWEIH
jgi:membrane-bound metal-dependent hydrolase YbcI (DUF457 family)